MYQVKQNAGSGRIEVVREDDGASIPLDPDNQDYCDFLTWASRQEDPALRDAFGLTAPARFFADAHRLTEYYKGSGDLLYAEEVAYPEGPRWELPPGRWQELGAYGRFSNLFKAIASTPGSRLDTSVGVIPKESKTWVTAGIRDELNAILGDESSDVRRLSTWPIERCFVYLDVSDFSIYPPGQQCLIINSVVRTVQALREWTDPSISEAVGSMEAMMCIGDGYIYVFSNPSFACVFASCLAYLIEILVARKSVPVGYHFRMSVHAGLVYSFWDPGRGNWNYIGDGINGGQRVLNAIGKDVDDVLFISSQIKQSLTANYDGSTIYSLLLNGLQNKGRRSDKHGNHWRVYEVNHTISMSTFFSGFIKNMRLPGL